MPFAETIAAVRRHASIMAAAGALRRARRLAEQSQAERTRLAERIQLAERTQAVGLGWRRTPGCKTKPTEKIQ